MNNLNRGRQPSSKSFQQTSEVSLQRSSFNKSFTYKTTCDAGYLIPYYVDEVIPGDTFNVSASIFARMATPISPFMYNLYLDTFFFFVPNRLLLDTFKRLMGEKDNPDDSNDYLLPVVNIPTGGIQPSTTYDYFGLPILENIKPITNLHGRAYNLIYNEHFKDQNLIDNVPFDRGAGPDAYTDYAPLRRRGKRHDYFTSCLPWPQKGDSVKLPLTGNAPVYGLSTRASENNPGGFTDVTPPHAAAATGTQRVINSARDSGQTNAGFIAPKGLEADLSKVTAINVNQLREAIQLQRLAERDARGGTRYTEIVNAHFGVISPDARLQRPEYLGGGTTPLNLVPIPQTSESTPAGNPLASLAAVGTFQSNGNGFVKSFTEHGVIIGMFSIRADLTYQQGIHKMFSRRDKYDLYWPTLAHLGEQAVLNKEIWSDGSAADEDVFGYQERFAEYKYGVNKITGELRSAFPQSLDTWHFAQDFQTRPKLNEKFIEENPPIARGVAVASPFPQFIIDSFTKVTASRAMPMYGIPGYMDHF